MTTPTNPRTRSTTNLAGAENSPPTETPTTTFSNEDRLATVLTQITDRLITSQRAKPNIKFKTPDPFDGKDRNKLRSFLQQCEAVFIAKKLDFIDDSDKVTFVGTYLTDQALHWYLRMVHAQDTSLVSWSAFTQCLKNSFGHPNEEAWAETRISQLRMYPNQDCVGYVTRFRDYADILNWDDKALMSSFKKGLPDRLLDELGRLTENSSTLEELIVKTLHIDEKYWETHSFKEQRAISRNNTGSRYQTSTANKGNERKPLVNYVPRKNPAPQVKKENAEDSGKTRSSHLTKDGKITQQERDRRMRLGLCMFCGENGHLRTNCPQLETKNRNQSSNVATVTEAKN